jgi:hypothetical protein
MMTMQQGRFHLGLGLALLLLLTAGRARANGYEGAKAVIDQAEQAFRADDDANALRLLKQALQAQTTVDRRHEEYGYAAYAHYRLGKYYWERDKRGLAAQEMKRAIAVTSNQQYVEAGYLVSRTDPLVLEVLPSLAKHKVVPLKDGRSIPNAIALLPRGQRVFVMEDHSVSELDRTARTLTVLHEQPGGSLYRMDARPDGSALVIAYEGGRNLVYLKTDGSAPVHVTRPFLPADLFFTPQGESAMLWSDRRAIKLSLPSGNATQLFELETPLTRLVLDGGLGGMILRTARAGVSAGFFPEGNSPDSVDGTFRYVVHFLDDGVALPLVERPYELGSRAEVMRIYAEDDRAFGLYYYHPTTKKNRLLTIDLVTRALKVSEPELGVEPWESSARGHGHAGTILFSAKHDYVVALSRKGTRLRVVRLTLADATPTSDQVFELASTLTAGDPEITIEGAGVLDDNQTLWIATPTAAIVVRPDGEARAAGLAALLGTKKYEWDGRPYGFSSPDELYLPLARGKGRDLVRIGFDEIERQGKRLPAVSGNATGKALPISHRDCTLMRAGLAQAFDGTPAQMDDVRRAVSAWKAKCAKEKGWLAFGLASHIMTMPATLGPREAKYQRDLFEAVRDADGPGYGLFGRSVTNGIDASRQQALGLLNVARFAAWLGDMSKAPSFACTTGMMFTQLLALLREDQNEWGVFWRAALATGAGCLPEPKERQLRRAWCDTIFDTARFDAARFGRDLGRDLKKECGR